MAKCIKIQGEATVSMTHYVWVPEDEIDDLVGDDETLACNIDEDECTLDVIEWQWIKGTVIEKST